jgi:hypothetical protein
MRVELWDEDSKAYSTAFLEEIENEEKERGKAHTLGIMVNAS